MAAEISPAKTLDDAAAAKDRIGTAAWLALIAALLGWTFDGAEMAVFNMVGRPALMDLLNTRDEQQVTHWFGVINAVLLIGGAAGGVLFGWLGDRLGRVRAMTLSVFTYAIFTGVCGFATAAWQVGLLRFLAALGMGGEWSLGVALVMEIWPSRSRAFMAGLIGAAANVGLLAVGVVGLQLIQHLDDIGRALAGAGLSQDWIDMLLRHNGWRLMMMLGAVPAVLTVFIRLFVPESERWRREQESGAASHWASADLLGVLIGTAGPALIVYLWAWDGPAWFTHTLTLRLVGTVAGLVLVTYGYTYPLARYFKRRGGPLEGEDGWPATRRRMLLGACLSTVVILGSWGTGSWLVNWADQLTGGARAAKEITQIWRSVGAIVGTLLAVLINARLPRRQSFALYCLLSVASVAQMVYMNDQYGPFFLASIFVMSAIDDENLTGNQGRVQG